MRIVILNIKLMITWVLLLFGVYDTQAQVASVSASVNLRQGPGTHYGRIAALPRGAAVHVNSCRGNWCQIRSSWGVGWVNGRYLIQGYNTGLVYGSDYAAPQSQVYLGLNIGSGFYDDPYYQPYYKPYYQPNFWPGYRAGYRPYGPRYSPRPFGREGWNPRWGVGPVRSPGGGWRR